MLSPAAVLGILLTGAAAAKAPITGAFGLTFDEPIPDHVLAASLGAPPHLLPPRNLPQTLPQAVPGEPPDWFRFRPQAVPDVLEDPAVDYYVLRDRSGYPLRILAEHPAPDCAADLLWLTRSLARKYRAEDDPFGAEREGFRRSARYESEVGQLDVSCGPTLLLEYTHPANYQAWLAAASERWDLHQAQLAVLDREFGKVQQERRRRFAERFTSGDRYRVDGVLGVAFGEPVEADRLGSFVADEATPIELRELPAELDDGRFTVTVGPDRLPVRVAAEFADPDRQRFQAFADALRAKYGTPLKDTPDHQIHKVGGDYLIARYVPAEAAARLVFIDDAGRNAQRERERLAKQARLAEAERQFEEETAGL